MELDFPIPSSLLRALSLSSPLLLLFYFYDLRMLEWEELESGFEGVVILLLERCWPGRVRANKCTLYALCYGPV